MQIALIVFVHATINVSTLTPAEYALATLVRTRSQLNVNLQSYTTLAKRMDELIEAVNAEINPLCEAQNLHIIYY